MARASRQARAAVIRSITRSGDHRAVQMGRERDVGDRMTEEGRESAQERGDGEREDQKNSG